MKILSEKSSLEFLEKEGFNVVPRKFFVTRFGLKKAIEEVGKDSVMKVFGEGFPKEMDKKIVSKLKTYTGAIEDFKKLKKLKKFEGVILKRKVKGKEFYVLIQRGFDSKSSLSFEVLNHEEGKERLFVSQNFPITKIKLEKMFKKSKLPKTFSNRAKKNLENLLVSICKFVRKNKKIKKIELNSLFVNEKDYFIVSARIVLNR